jgi:hypothetical protein
MTCYDIKKMLALRFAAVLLTGRPRVAKWAALSLFNDLALRTRASYVIGPQKQSTDAANTFSDVLFSSTWFVTEKLTTLLLIFC